MKAIMVGVTALGLAAAGCQSTGEGALYGAALGAAGGAVAGEVFAGRPGTGAAAGALIGAAIGAYEGCSRAGTCFGRARDNGRRYYDQGSRRYYYEDPQYGDTYWDDGSFRNYGNRGRGRGYNRRRGY
ncbi:MAG: hypothetical protein GC152_06560 [Alphaproteobacteria bacterium]|nr:hypothetical protein [Alphaproteobacteria bacterium]